MTTIWFSLVCACVLLTGCVFVLIRNTFVLNVRLHFIDTSRLWVGGFYDRLPTYDQMLFDPIYWGLWTKAQWELWSERQEAA